MSERTKEQWLKELAHYVDCSVDGISEVPWQALVELRLFILAACTDEQRAATLSDERIWEMTLDAFPYEVIAYMDKQTMLDLAHDIIAANNGGNND
jgi:hypothetical protein